MTTFGKFLDFGYSAKKLVKSKYIQLPFDKSKTFRWTSTYTFVRSLTFFSPPTIFNASFAAGERWALLIAISFTLFRNTEDWMSVFAKENHVEYIVCTTYISPTTSSVPVPWSSSSNRFFAVSLSPSMVPKTFTPLQFQNSSNLLILPKCH